MSNKTQDVIFYGKMLTFSRVKLETNDFDIIKEQLAIVSPTKDSQIPIIIESSVLQDLTALTNLFWEWGLQPIGVVKGLLDEQAKELKIALFPGDGKRMQRIQPNNKKTTNKKREQLEEGADEKLADKANDTTSETLETARNNIKAEDTKNNVQDDDNKSYLANDDSDNTSNNDANKENVDNNTTQKVTLANATTYTVPNTPVYLGADDDTAIDHITSLVYDKMLRSGQSINHVGGDLILTSTVNNGSEVITDNNLHIYGKGLGRLVAGATGDKDAHIFCQYFNPTLVSVAGTYCSRDDIPEEYINKPVHISYQEGEGLIYRIMEH